MEATPLWGYIGLPSDQHGTTTKPVRFISFRANWVDLAKSPGLHPQPQIKSRMRSLCRKAIIALLRKVSFHSYRGLCCKGQKPHPSKRHPSPTKTTVPHCPSQKSLWASVSVYGTAAGLCIPKFKQCIPVYLLGPLKTLKAAKQGLIVAAHTCFALCLLRWESSC